MYTWQLQRIKREIQMKWPMVKSRRTIEEKEGESMPGHECWWKARARKTLPVQQQIHRTLYKSTAHFTNSLCCSLQFTVPVLYTHFKNPICSLRIDFIHNIREYSVHKYTIDSRDLSYYFVHLYSSLLYYNLWFSVSPIVTHKMLIRWAMKRT